MIKYILEILLSLFGTSLLFHVQLFNCCFRTCIQISQEADQVAKVLELQLQHHSYQWIFRVDFPQMFKLDLEKAEEPEIKLPASVGSSKKQESSRKTSISALLTMPKPLTVWITINCGKFFKRWEYQTTLPASWEICMQVKEQQLELDMEQQTAFKSGKEYIKAVYCHPVYLTYKQNTSWKCWAGWITALIKTAGRNINNLRYVDDMILMAESEEELKSLLMKVKEEWKSWLKTQHSKN